MRVGMNTPTHRNKNRVNSKEEESDGGGFHFFTSVVIGAAGMFPLTYLALT